MSLAGWLQGRKIMAAARSRLVLSVGHYLQKEPAGRQRYGSTDGFCALPFLTKRAGRDAGGTSGIYCRAGRASQAAGVAVVAPVASKWMMPG
jgi:hypothetical protein